ncbi:hypothetical protein QQS21_000347 [Conoideocrella luteorostrata]|uniref:AB hydrolase-1 domain-containing protein n=1 Tax=Conoideocrella luteorostrata TaxID=1105319 RepID=A0AAJ0CZY7_9HYPO|nr:hypothetical protein QQS21_000347 [Conoideocrella luteorostrata]
MALVLGAIAVILHLLKPVKASLNFSATCIDLVIPVNVSANSSVYDGPKIDSNIDTADWMWDIYTWSHPDVMNRTKGTVEIRETLDISAKLCVPRRGRKSDILQIATHGLGFDKRYWDVQVHAEEYSYVNAAIKQGYSILTYDRVGNGHSSKPDAYVVAQESVAVEVLRELTRLARNGDLAKASKMKHSRRNPICAYRPNKIVHVGHSFGSAITVALLSLYGNVSDGALMTSFMLGSQTGLAKFSEFGFEFAPQHDSRRFGDRSSGYLVQATQTNIQQIYLRKGSFKPEVLRYAELIKQTTSVGEIVTTGVLLGHPAPLFSGPIQFFVGEEDIPVCGGDCRNRYSLEVLKVLYPVAADISVYLQPGTGHGLALSTNATAGYEVMFSYLESHGL